MKARGRKPSPLHGRGPIDGNAVYPTSVFLKRLGIARSSLQSLRRRGLPVHNLGRRCALVFGWEFVDFLRANPDRGNGDASVGLEESREPAGTVPADGTKEATP